MCLVALLDEELVSIPEDDPYLKRLGERARAALGTRSREQRVDRSFEVMRLLVSRWLLRKGRIAVGEIQRQTGLSHPSVSKALDALGPAIERRRDRSVILASFPTEAWNRLIALAPQVRQPRAFVDASGRAMTAAALLERLAKHPPVGVALGGVPATRHWHRGLDLEGLPRVDLSVHAPKAPMDTAFVEGIDPALVPAPRGTPPLLVVHAVPRAESLFFHPPTGMPIADPVEALLDLHELRLVEQADDLVRAMRGLAEPTKPH